MKRFHCVSSLYLFIHIFKMSCSQCTEYFVIFKESNLSAGTPVVHIKPTSNIDWNAFATLSNSTVQKECVVDLSCLPVGATTCRSTNIVSNHSEDTRQDSKENNSEANDQVTARNDYIDNSYSTVPTVTTLEYFDNSTSVNYESMKEKQEQRTKAAIIVACVLGGFGTSLMIYFAAKKIKTLLQSANFRLPEA